MSGLNSATIAILLAKGLSGVDLLEVAKAMEAAPHLDRALERRRAYDRERKRQKRAANGHSVGPSADGFPNERDILTLPAHPVISNEITSLPENDDDPEVRPEHVLEAWNAMAVRSGVRQARMTPERRKRLKTFLCRHEIDDITEAISAVERSPFCRGENDRSWKPGIDFLLQPGSFTKLIEGTYG